MIVLKFIHLLIYSLGTVVFLYYVNISHLYSYYEDWIFCNFKNSSEYDYIIVGAGTAGSILATRLTQAGAKVLLLEAGGAPSYFFNVPVLSPLFINTPYDWQYKTVPQENACKGLENKQSNWPAGKILGGSSRLNYMVHVLGHPEDYNSWFPDYKEPVIENGGLLHVHNQTYHTKLADSVLEGVKELSHPVRNINKAKQTGFMRAEFTMKDGERWSTDRILYKYKNEKLTILKHSSVYKILFKSKKAVGVEFLKNNQNYKAYAKNGVISSSGTIGSPKLLMLSGIGPKQHLNELDIHTKVNLPVGQNLMDHISTGLDLVTINSTQALNIMDVVNPFAAADYYLFQNGPWTSAGVDVVGTLYSQKQKERSSEAPNLQIMIIPLGISQDNGVVLRKNLGIPDDLYNEYFAPLTYSTAITISPILLHPKSMGEVKLRSKNPNDLPLIDPKYLSNQEDVLTLIEGIEFIKQLIKTEAMKKHGAELYTKPLPGCEHLVFDTLDYWKCYVRHLTFTVYHPIGTCCMGKVVDSNFRVYGTKNLFVVDASVFPKLPSGNTNTPTVMLAEKAASLLIEEFMRKKLIKVCYRRDIFSYS